MLIMYLKLSQELIFLLAVHLKKKKWQKELQPITDLHYILQLYKSKGNSYANEICRH